MRRATGALNIGQAAALAEGTSDFYAMDYLVDEELETDTPYTFAEYLGSWLRARRSTAPRSPTPMSPAASRTRTARTGRRRCGRCATELGVDATRACSAPRFGARRRPSILDMRHTLLIAARTRPRTARSGPCSPPAGWATSRERRSRQHEPAGQRHRPVRAARRRRPGHAARRRARRGPEARRRRDGHDRRPRRRDFGAFLATTTAANGRYALAEPPGRRIQSSRRARRPTRTTRQATWRSLAARGRRRRTSTSRATGPRPPAAPGSPRSPARTTPRSGCGPGGLIDDRRDVVWGSATGGQSIVVDLGAPVDVASVRIDPAAGCGDNDTAALGTADVLAATGPDTFTPLTSPLTFAPADNRTLKSVFNGTRNSVRFIKLVAKTPQSHGGRRRRVRRRRGAAGAQEAGDRRRADRRHRRGERHRPGRRDAVGDGEGQRRRGARRRLRLRDDDGLRQHRRRERHDQRRRGTHRARGEHALPLPRRRAPRRPPLRGRGPDVRDRPDAGDRQTAGRGSRRTCR